MSKKKQKRTPKTEIISKKKTAELVVMPPAAMDPMDILNALVQKNVAELLAAKESAILQPFLQARSVGTQLRKNQNVIELNKFRHYFRDWGCLICGSKEQGHKSLGMCPNCLGKTVSRMKTSIRRATTERAQDDGRIVDLEQLAQQSLMPAIGGLKPQKRKACARIET